MNKIIESIICTYENILSDKICNNIIEKFKIDEHVYNKFDKNSNISILKIRYSPDPIWGEIDSIICKIINEYSNIYNKHIRETNLHFSFSYNYNDNGYFIYKFNKNIGFHNVDNPFTWNKKNGFAIASFIFFLNTIENGAEIEFFNIKNIKPEKGNLIIFPATWDLVYKHNIPISSDNYIITGTLYYNYNK
tara:strand:+ start:15865 stop:16437 length:573 start_codon:yes stop_codon:yes gene_type:complete